MIQRCGVGCCRSPILATLSTSRHPAEKEVADAVTVKKSMDDAMAVKKAAVNVVAVKKVVDKAVVKKKATDDAVVKKKARDGVAVKKKAATKAAVAQKVTDDAAAGDAACSALAHLRLHQQEPRERLRLAALHLWPSGDSSAPRSLGTLFKPSFVIFCTTSVILI
jgi:hypothetical protein